MTDWWVIILQLQGAFYPLNPLKTDVSRGRQVFQVGQAPSGPTVIWPLMLSSVGLYVLLSVNDNLKEFRWHMTETTLVLNVERLSYKG